MLSAEAIISRWDKMKSDRATLETHWQDCADYALPRKSDVITRRIEGQQVMLHIYDVTAIEANERMAAGLFAYLCPPTQQWFTLMPADGSHKDDDELTSWFRKITEIISDRISNSNFHQQIHEHFLDLGTFGTGCLYSEEDPGQPGGVVFRNDFVSTYCADVDYRGEVDTVYRRIEFTARQAAQKFGAEKLVGACAEAFKDPATAGKVFPFIHAVFPNSDPVPGKQGSDNFQSVWVDATAKMIVSDAGYHEMPYAVDRFEMSGEANIYGYGPTSRALPTIKLTNAQQRTLLRAAQMAVDPPTLLPNDGSISSWRNTPGALNYWNAANPAAKPEQMQFKGNVQINLEMIQQNQGVILETYNVNLFNALAQAPSRAMTATEVQERVEEKLTLLTPFLGRLQRELFDPLIIRIFNLLLRAGAFGELPIALIKKPTYKIEYGGKLALALQQLGVRAFSNTVVTLAPIAEMRPEIWDNFDFDKSARGIARANALPEGWMMPAEDVAKLRQARAEAMQRQAEMEAVDMAAGAYQKGSKRAEPGSPAAMTMKEAMG